MNAFLFTVDDLPFELDKMSTLQDPTDMSALVVSGGIDHTNDLFSDAILKLTCTTEEYCKWQILSHKLHVPRSYHVSFFINKPLNCSTFQVAELLESKSESKMDEAHQTLEKIHGMLEEDIQDQAECEY